MKGKEKKTRGGWGKERGKETEFACSSTYMVPSFSLFVQVRVLLYTSSFRSLTKPYLDSLHQTGTGRMYPGPGPPQTSAPSQS